MKKNKLNSLFIIFFLQGCASFEPEGSPSSPEQSVVSTSSAEAESSESSAQLSPNTVVFVYSLSSNPLAKKLIDRSRALSLASKLSSKSDNIREVTTAISLQSLAGSNLDGVYQTARALATRQMQKDIRLQLPDNAKLELGLASIKAKQIPMAEYWLSQVSSSKDRSIKAGELNARGIIAKLDNRLPEAVAFWREALKYVSSYEPARLNIGYTALTYGDAQTARSMLAPLQDDFFAAVGLLQAERLLNNVAKVNSLCTRLKASDSNYKPLLFSCALNTFQGEAKFAEAKTQLQEASRARGGGAALNEKIFQVIGEVEANLRSSETKSIPVSQPSQE